MQWRKWPAYLDIWYFFFVKVGYLVLSMTVPQKSQVPPLACYTIAPRTNNFVTHHSLSSADGDGSFMEGGNTTGQKRGFIFFLEEGVHEMVKLQ
jgi:hypothetical protein